MNILYQGNSLIEDVAITSAAEHEQELMKSDFIKLSWNDCEQRILPANAYIEYGGLHYSLLEPYIPEQKSETHWYYEPKFQHPKMYLSKVTFTRPTKDTESNDITLLDWPYTGFIGTLLEYFCEQINKALNLTGVNAFRYVVIGDINNIISVSFNTLDILSALTNTANVCKCECHLDWEQKTLYFGHVMYLTAQASPFKLIVGENITVPSIRNSKEGFWNAFEPQGSTRNITRRAASGEHVQGNVRLSLREYKVDEQHENGIYPDGIIYTDGNGTIITKEQYEAQNDKPFIKPLIFDDVYPKLDLYAYNIRYRERYLLENEDDPDSRIISTYDKDGNPVYKRYAIWYMQLAWPEYTDDTKTTVRAWHDYALSKEVFAYVKKVTYEGAHYYTYTLDMRYVKEMFQDAYSTKTWVEHRVNLQINEKTVKATVREYKDGNLLVYLHTSRDTAAHIDAFAAEVKEGSVITFIDGDYDIYPDKAPKANVTSQVVDGKKLFGQFKVNTRQGAETSPLAGRGDGDNGNYGFQMIYLGMEGEGYVEEANREPITEGDTGIVDMSGNRARATKYDYEIIYQQSNNVILPTTAKDLIIPKGKGEPSLLGNIVNLYNIVMGPSYEESAKSELENATKKYISNSLEDNNSYTFKTDAVAWEQLFREDSQHNRDSHLFIGEKVYYIDGNTYTDEHPLTTRVMKIVTKIDYGFEQEITVGNEVLKGAQTSLKEQVETLVSGGAGGVGGEGGMSDSSVQRIVQNWVTPRFLSKTNDDAAEGVIGFLEGLWIKAKGLFGFDKDGNATVANINVAGDSSISGDMSVDGDTSVKGDISTNGNLSADGDGVVGGKMTVGSNMSVGGSIKSQGISSHNYSGDGVGDSGFSLTSNYNGHSKLTVDELYVRMKAVFESLEVRKALVTGGNQVQSCAANVIVRTDFINDNGQVIGYKEVKTPFMLLSKAFVLNKQLNNVGFYAGKKKIRKVLTSSEFAQVNRIRCYFLAEEGGRKIENWWQVGDLARCKTFNLTQSYRETYVSGSEQKAGNIHWWRRVVGISSTPTEIDGKQYHWFDVSVSQCMQGSDLPAAGDEVSQWGNVSNPDRMNLIVSESNGEAAYKMFIGIYTFSDTLCWYGGDACKIRFSPRGGVKVVSNMFQLITDYGEAPVPMDRGRWLEITATRDDYEPHALVRKCYYFDKVSHIGSYWLCVHSTEAGAHWVRPQVWNNDSYKLFDDNGRYLNNGNYISDDAYNALDDSQKEQCGRVMDYTTAEPSESSAAWQMAVEKGEDALNVEIITDKGTVIKNGDGTRTLTAIVYKGTEDITDTLPASAFSWTRNSSDPTLVEWDNAFNAAHVGVGKTIVISASDVMKNAVFSCDISD